MRAFDMLVHFTEAGNGRKIGSMHAFADLTGIASGRPDPCNPPTLEHDLLIYAPGAAVHVEQPTDAQAPIGCAAAERRQNQVLQDANLIGRVDQEIVRPFVRGCHDPLHPMTALSLRLVSAAACYPG